MGERRGLKALELWCKRITEGYPGVKIDNMTTSWRDGLGFCAIINHFRPDLIDFDKLNKDDIFRNNELAFRVAQQYLGIPALLDAEDMVEYPVPDRLSILTYLSQFYNALACNAGSSPSRIAPKRQAPVPDRSVLPSSASPPTKMAIRSSAGIEIARDKPCVKCKLPVFLVDRRLIAGKQLYHSACFRCARCDQPLSAGNYYETEVDGQFCCETCPNGGDPEHIVPHVSLLARSLSDEQKAGLYEMATPFKTAVLEMPESDCSEYTLARTHFMQELIADVDADAERRDTDVPPALPKSKPPDDKDLELDKSFADSEVNSDSGVPDSLKLTNVSVNSSPARISDSDVKVLDKNKNHSDMMDEKSPDFSTKENDISSVTSVADSSILNSSDDLKRESKISSIIEISDDSIITISSEEFSKDELNSRVVSNPFEEAKSAEKSLNPFSDDDDESEEEEEEKPQHLKRIVPRWSLLKPEGLHVPSGSSSNTKSLNPFSSDEDDELIVTVPKRMSLNPFSDDEDDEPTVEVGTKQKSKKVLPRHSEYKLTTGSTGDTPESYKSLRVQRISVRPNMQMNPISLNPFSSDEDDDDRSTNSHMIEAKSQRLSFGGSSNSLASSSSSVPSTLRKKKPAPKPPIPFNSSPTTQSPQPSITSSPSTSAQQSPRPRKIRRAPLPPSTSTPAGPAMMLNATHSPIISTTNSNSSLNLSNSNSNLANLTKTLKIEESSNAPSLEFEKEKVAKDEANRQTQSGHQSQMQLLGVGDKSTLGKWKRRKGQAPSLPVPQKRAIKALPMTELKKELDIIEVQLQGLTKQGERLETIIRDQCEGPDADPNATRIPIEAEDLILQLFEVVNEKNELCRRQAELMYMKRQHRLEVEQAEIEYQVRCLMLTSCKTDTDKERETQLLERLVEVVNLRAEIVECLEMDRVRGIEEDCSISYSMNTYANKRDEVAVAGEKVESPKKKDKKGKTLKKKIMKLKKFAKMDVDKDKDIDESETKSTCSSSSKDKSKGKSKDKDKKKK